MHSSYRGRLRHSLGSAANIAAASWPRASRLASSVAGALLVAGSVSGCSVLTQDYWTWNQRGVSSDVAEVRIEPSTDGYITHMKVYSVSGVTTIKGATRRQATSCSDCSACIEMTVKSANGAVIDEVAVPARPRVHRNALEWFTAELPYEMKPGMVLVVRYHYGVSHAGPRGAEAL